jgi:uncharacterized protein (DUF427 family)
VLKAHTLYFEDCAKRVRAVFNGETVADSRRGEDAARDRSLAHLLLPEEDLRYDLLEESERVTHCPFKGDAAYRSVRVRDRVAEDAVWGYPEPLEDAPPIAGYAAFYHGAMDKWLEEDEETLGHPHDPYHRVDVLESSRHVRVKVGGKVVAETDRPKILFETSLPPRYYFPPESVRTELLTQSETKTVCPYKGVGSHWSAEVGGERVEDVAWGYPKALRRPRRSKDASASTTTGWS